MGSQPRPNSVVRTGKMLCTASSCYCIPVIRTQFILADTSQFRAQTLGTSWRSKNGLTCISKPRRVDWGDWDHFNLEITSIIFRRYPDYEQRNRLNFELMIGMIVLIGVIGLIGMIGFMSCWNDILHDSLEILEMHRNFDTIFDVLLLLS